MARTATVEVFKLRGKFRVVRVDRQGVGFTALAHKYANVQAARRAARAAFPRLKNHIVTISAGKAAAR